MIYIASYCMRMVCSLQAPMNRSYSWATALQLLKAACRFAKLAHLLDDLEFYLWECGVQLSVCNHPGLASSFFFDAGVSWPPGVAGLSTPIRLEKRYGHCRSSFQGLTFSKIWAAKRLDAWSCSFLGSCLEPGAASRRLEFDRLQVSREPKLPIGARKLVLPVFSTQDSSAVAPKQEEERKKKQIL